MLRSKKLATVFNYLSIALSLLYSMFCTPFVLRALGPSEHGVYALTSSIIPYLNLLQFGFDAAFMRYYITYRREGNIRKAEELAGMFMGICGIIAAITLAVGVVLALNISTVFGGKITPTEYQIAGVLMRLTVFGTVLTVLTLPFQALVTAHEAFVFQAAEGLLVAFLKIATLIPLLFFGYKSVALVSVNVVLSAVTLIFYAIFVFKILKIRFRFSKFDPILFKRMGVFSFFIFLQGVLNILNIQIDPLLLARFWGSVEVSVYSVSAQLRSLFITLSSVTSSFFVPMVNQMVTEKRGDRALTDLMIRLGRLQFLIAAFLLSAFIFFGKSFVQFYAGPGYMDMYPVALLLMVPMLLPLSMDLCHQIARAKALHKTSTLIYLLVAVLNLLISFPLCRRYGAIGTAAGTCIGTFIANNVFQIWYSQKVIHLDMRRWAKSLASLLPSLLFPVLAGIYLMEFVEIYSVSMFLLLACGYTAISAVSFWLFALNQEEKTLFSRPIIRMFQRVFYQDRKSL